MIASGCYNNVQESTLHCIALLFPAATAAARDGAGTSHLYRVVVAPLRVLVNAQAPCVLLSIALALDDVLAQELGHLLGVREVLGHAWVRGIEGGALLEGGADLAVGGGEDGGVACMVDWVRGGLDMGSRGSYLGRRCARSA
jgi:hypothetical protein